MRKGHLHKVFFLSYLHIYKSRNYRGLTSRFVYRKKGTLKKIYNSILISFKVFITKLLRFRFFKITLLYGLESTLFDFIQLSTKNEDKERKHLPLYSF